MERKDIINAWATIREENNTIPDEVIDFMKYSALAALPKTENKFHPIYEGNMITGEVKKVGDKVQETNEAWVRNQLQPIVNYFAMLDSDDPDEGLVKLMNCEQERAVESLTRIINKILPAQHADLNSAGFWGRSCARLQQKLNRTRAILARLVILKKHKETFGSTETEFYVNNKCKAWKEAYEWIEEVEK